MAEDNEIKELNEFIERYRKVRESLTKADWKRLDELLVETTRSQLQPNSELVALINKLITRNPDDPDMKRLKEIFIWLKFSPDADK